jgi:hypothetical protein
LETAKWLRSAVRVPSVRLSVILPMGLKSKEMSTAVPSGRFTFFTCT